MKISLSFLLIFFSLLICLPSGITQAQNPFVKFIENKGQVLDSKENPRPDILFSTYSGDAKIYLRKRGISYVFTQEEGWEEFIKAKSDIKESSQRMLQVTDSLQKQIKTHIQRVDMDFIGINQNPTIVSELPAQGKFNYYLAHCPRGVTGVSAYHKITYQSIYPEIDACFYGDKANGMKYDFIVKPGGDPENIQIKYSGQEAIKLVNGKIVIE